uniref:uncharacterized protein LOC122578299 isoform X2 n=1 Tax=Erigeron canadensis TaxID=72917 RepID=UPI001CB8FC42|nr:uncharacterized protein LOC122578299 isoform X2 [Erigeron canadensis]
MPTSTLPYSLVELFQKEKLFSSPGATFTMFTREDRLEMAARDDFALAKNFIAQLQGLLEQEKAQFQRLLEQEKANARTKWKKDKKRKAEAQPQNERNVTMLKKCWEGLEVKFTPKENKARLIVTKLENIQKIVKKLPARLLAEIEPSFLSLSTEAVMVRNDILECVKLDCDDTARRLTVLASYK